MSSDSRQGFQQRLDNDDIKGLAPQDTFTFECHTDCMGTCCNRITILLDPWDVENMARHLDLTGREFIDQYCNLEIGTESRWPFVQLRHVEHGPCSFMLADGKCKVYPVRSRNCRTYPIGRAVRLNSVDNEFEERIFMVDPLGFCLGHQATRVWTVQEWLDDSDCLKYFQLSDLYLQLIHYAATELQSRVWMNSKTAQMMYPFLFAPEILRSKLGLGEDQVSHEELYRRRLKALQALLTEVAAGFGLGPGASSNDNGTTTPGGSLMERVSRILRTGA